MSRLEVITGIKCYICEEIKSSDDFYKNRAKKSGLSSECKLCSAAKSREWYKRNRKYRLALNKKQADKTRKLYLEYLKTHPCIDCGENDPVVLEPDHIGNKTYNISHLVLNFSWTRVLEELENCVIRCSNCHKRKTAKEQGWYKYVTS